ncbi:galactoside O-acetyltransferase [Salana multivorans]|uniref:Acetyltransferase n=1 Tax=Salana multivorans TaxID=120377 RepID=A0A3N2D9Y0_9MICO|nr:sugar O-acetyltransferase [Salana multivorans]MBN8882271.1 sugar O-acetyltransferase [Salana multivorans]ROR96610.1 galactoside O-acetyltransferase [Salana multivorans]
MNNDERMRTGLLYNPGVAELVERQTAALETLYDFNATRPSEGERRAELMTRMFASVGEGCYIEPPLHANWGGQHVHLGHHVYANFNLTLVDDGEIHIGDHVMFGPNVTVTTAGHPVLPELRITGAQFNIPVRIGRNVWVGAGVQIMPGVTIGDNSVIGAGSVVTHDIPADVVALGTPCRVLRPIDERDREVYWRDRRIDVTPEELLALR